MTLNKLNNLNLKTKAQVLTSFYILLTILVVYFYIIPASATIKLIKEDIFTEKVEQEKKLNRERNYANLGSKIKEIEPRLDVLESIYINANRKLEFITTLEGIAANTRVEQKLNLDLKFNSDGTVKKVPIIIEISGSYQSVLSCTFVFEHDLCSVEIKSLVVRCKHSNGTNIELFLMHQHGYKNKNCTA